MMMMMMMMMILSRLQSLWTLNDQTFINMDSMILVMVMMMMTIWWWWRGGGGRGGGGGSNLYLSSFLYWNPASFSSFSLVISGSWTLTVFFSSFSLSSFMSPSWNVPCWGTTSSSYKYRVKHNPTTKLQTTLSKSDSIAIGAVFPSQKKTNSDQNFHGLLRVHELTGYVLLSFRLQTRRA